MEFDFTLAMDILSRTPKILKAWLRDFPDSWVTGHVGENTLNPMDILRHFIHREYTDWIPRARLILEKEGIQEAEPFDRFAQFDESQDKSLEELLETFAWLRQVNLAMLRGFDLRPSDYRLPWKHPELGIVNLEQLLASWVVHDLDHIEQIAHLMAGQYRGAVGPWEAYLTTLEE